MLSKLFLLTLLSLNYLCTAKPVQSNCISSCERLPDGDYQSCKGCSVFASCSNEIMLDNRPCPADTVWNDLKKKCDHSSETCNTAAAKVSTVDVSTGDNYIYKYVHDLGIDVTKRDSIVFSVQACNDAHIALSAIKGQDNTDTYEVVIGGWGNMASVIRDYKQGANKDELRKSLRNPLSCKEKRPFWISWTNGNIKVGTGSYVGDNVFMSWNDPGPHPVNYVAVATGWGSTGQWTFPSEKADRCVDSCVGVDAGNYQSCETCNGFVSCFGGSLHAMNCPADLLWDAKLKRCEPAAKVSTVDVSTENNYMYKYVHDMGIDVTQRDSIMFSVQACNDAHIALSAIKGQDNTDTYEVVIGGWGNMASVIRDYKQGDNKDELRKSLRNPLSCNEKRPFWISWTNGNIKVGTGSYVGDNVFMSWNDTGPHPVNYVAVATGWGSTGQWTFPSEKADRCVDSCVGVDAGNYQSCETCNGFVSCFGGSLHAMNCPADLLWDDKLKRCDRASNTCVP